MFISINRRPHRSYPFSVICPSLIALLTLLWPAGRLDAQTGQDVTALVPGKLVERDLAGGQAHSYRIPLAAGQYLHVVVVQRGVDVVTSLFDPGGRQVVEVDSPSGAQGPELLYAIAESSGDYRLEVRSLEKAAAAGRYGVRVAEMRAATERDRSFIAAERVFMRAELLLAEGTPESLRGAIEKYNEAIPFYRAVGDQAGEANAFNNLGAAHNELNETQQAMNAYSRALQLYEAVRDHRGQAIAVSNIAAAYDDLGDRRRAADNYERASRLWRAVGDTVAEATMLGKMAAAYYKLEDSRRALEAYERSLPLWRTAGNRRAEAATLNNIGAIYSDTGEKRRALDEFAKALAIRRAVGDKEEVAATLNNIGAVYDDLGEKRQALGNYEEALLLWRSAGNRSEEATTLNNVGVVHSSLGEKQKALDQLTKALALRQAAGDREGEATTLSNIGNVYDDLGERRLALENYERALLIWRAAGSRRAQAATLSNMAAAHYEMGENRKSLEEFAEALTLRRAVGDKRGEAVTLNNAGTVLNSLGDRRRALDNYEQALQLWRAAGDRDGEAATLNNIGAVYYDSGERRKALERFSEALPLSRAVGNGGGEAATLANIALGKFALGDLVAASASISEAISIVESLRAKVGSQALRASYFSTAHDYYDFYITILMQRHRQQPSAGHDARALQVSERARARGLLEMLAEARLDIRRDVDPGLIERERLLQERLSAKVQRQVQLRSSQYTSAQAEAMAKEVENLITEARHVEAQIRQSSPNYSALTQPRPLDLREIQGRVLGPDTVLLEYFLGKERSYLWVVTQTSMASYELPGRPEIETAASRFYERLASRSQALAPEGDDELLKMASGLSEMLLRPAAAHLGQKRLLIIADGALQYVPFAALTDPAPNRRGIRGITPLVLQHEVVSLPSASILPQLRSERAKRSPPPQTLVALADPVFSPDDARVGRAMAQRKTGRLKAAPQGPGSTGGDAAGGEQQSPSPGGATFERLPGSGREAQKISSITPPGKARLALGFEASRALAISGELGRYRYVHFATHAQGNDIHPELSAIVLSLVDEDGKLQNGYLRLNDVFNLDLSADGVVLSGCETGLGKKIRGEGLVGLTRGFMYAGAPRVLASLWRGGDEEVIRLMGSFYEGMLKRGMRPAAALRASQIEMISRERWRSPHNWAAFVLQGEWR